MQENDLQPRKILSHVREASSEIEIEKFQTSIKFALSNDSRSGNLKSWERWDDHSVKNVVGC